MNYRDKYNLWLESEYFDEETKNELKNITDEIEIEDRFYEDLSFGTAGLRGKIGAGTNRMNIYTVSLATEALARVIAKKGKDKMEKGVAIAYDVRRYSAKFAETAARVLAANGIKVYLFEDIRPTPMLAYTVRKLGTMAGIVVTASHNPKDYNGYKLYWEDGSQILDDIADEILDEIKHINNFGEIKYLDLDEAINKNLIQYIGKELDDAYDKDLLSLALNDDIDKDIKIVYTPLNGAGNIPVRRILEKRGFKNVIVVPEQENPDSNFTTVGYPNPEDPKAFEYAERLAEKVNADIVIATDPDSDRLAMMVKTPENKYRFMNGNQTGYLLVNYLLSQRNKKGDLPADATIVKSIVTGDLSRDIAKKYGVDTVETLTGFKNICGKANEFDTTKEKSFIFGYEESIGYVYGTIVRDKDGINSSMFIAEMAAYYKKQGKTLLEVLEELYKEYGYYKEYLMSIVLEGMEGNQRIKRIMEDIRKSPIEDYDSMKLMNIIDYLNDDTGNPKSNVLKYYLDDGSWYAVRPSGTEPKIKIYIYTKDKNESIAEEKINIIKTKVLGRVDTIK